MFGLLKIFFGPILRHVRDPIKLWRLERRFRNGNEAPGRDPHGLDAPLIVSLTSYRPRFRHLHLNIMSLLAQNMPADRVILWIAHEEKSDLPDNVTRLEAKGLDIRFTEDLRSFKKLIPALKEFPTAFLVTADDDVIYPRGWLGSLVSGYNEQSPSIVCHRAHRIVRNATGFAPYLQWERNVRDERSTQPSTDLLPIGVGGVLYPPRSLHPDVHEVSTFTSLCPHADDLWFWWMGRRKGTRLRRVDEKPPELIPGSQDVSLMNANWGGGNDRQLAALVSAFGMPDP